MTRPSSRSLAAIARVLLVAGRWFGEPVGARQVGWTALAIAGVVVVVLGSGPHMLSVRGDLLAVGSMLCWTGYWLVSKRARADVEPVEYTADVMIVTTLAMTPLALLSREPLSGLTHTDLLWLLLMAVVPGSAHLLINWAHRFLDVAVSSVIVSVNPVAAAGFALVLLGQPLHWLQVVGGVIAVGAVALVASRADQQKASPTADQQKASTVAGEPPVTPTAGERTATPYARRERADAPPGAR